MKKFINKKNTFSIISQFLSYFSIYSIVVIFLDINQICNININIKEKPVTIHITIMQDRNKNSIES